MLNRLFVATLLRKPINAEQMLTQFRVCVFFETKNTQKMSSSRLTQNIPNQYHFNAKDANRNYHNTSDF